MNVKRFLAFLGFGITSCALLLTRSYAMADLWSNIWDSIKNWIPYILTSPLLLILLFRFWGASLVDIIVKLKWVVVMALPTAIIYISLPEIANYSGIETPSWFLYISPPLVLDCTVGYALATGNSTYLMVALVWLVLIYFITVFLILSGGNKNKKGDSERSRPNYYYIFAPIVVWVILSMWGLLMINIHTFIFNALSGMLSAEMLGGSGLQISVLVFAVFGILIVFLVVARIRSKKEPTRGMSLLYCKEVEDKMVCVYDPKKKETEKDTKKAKKDGRKKKKTKE